MEQNFLKTQGVVVAVEGDYARVEYTPQSACGGCQSASGCGTSALSKLFSSTSSAPVTVINQLNAKVGDRVVLTLDESIVVRHAFMAYGLPLIGLFTGAITLKALASAIFEGLETLLDWAAVFGGGMGLLLGWWITRRFYRPLLPHISEVVG